MVDFVYRVTLWLLHFEEYGGGLASKEAFAYPTRSVQVLPRNREHAFMEEGGTYVAATSVAAGFVAGSVASSVVSSMAIETRHLQRREKESGEKGSGGKGSGGKGRKGRVRKPQRVSKLSAKVLENLVDKVVMKLFIWCNGS
ncbi:hypothetical protein V8E54_008409 [Elaphomyces granulatus]